MKKNTHKTYTVQEATAALMKYCAYQERCHQEVEQKLKRMHMIETAREHIIHHLIQENFLNETRFSKSFVRGKFRVKKWGRLRLVNELKRRNISRFNIEAALQEITPEQYGATFHEIAEKKWASLHHDPLLKRKQKLMNYLQYRGWESQLIYEKIQDLAHG